MKFMKMSWQALLAITCAAMIAVLGSLASADAQVFGPGPPDTTENAVNGTIPAPGAGPRAVVGGWNYVRPTFCYAFRDVSTTWVVLIATDQSQWYTGNPVIQTMLTAACQTGNVVAFFLISASTWNQVVTYPN
jgi:hypothetical protein